MISTHISFSYANLLDLSIDGRCWGTVMDLQVDDFPFRQEQVATSGDKQSKTKPMPPRQKAKPVATSRWFGLLRSWSWGCHLLSAAAGTVPFPAASIFCSLQTSHGWRTESSISSSASTCTSRGWDPLLSDWRNSSSFPFFFPFLFWREDWYLCPFAVIDWTDGATFELKQTKDHARFQAFRLLSLTGSCRVQMFNHRAKRREPVTLRICFAIWETELCSSRHRTDNITQTAPVQQTRELNLVTQMSLKLVETETSLPTSVRCFSITGTWAGLNVKTDHSLHCIRAELDLSRWMVPHLVETSMCPCLLMTLVQLKILHNAECRLCTTRDAGDEISFYWE